VNCSLEWKSVAKAFVFLYAGTSPSYLEDVISRGFVLGWWEAADSHNSFVIATLSCYLLSNLVLGGSSKDSI